MDVYIIDGGYVQGRKVGQGDTVSASFKIAIAALNEARHPGPFSRVTDSNVVWIDDAEGLPVGILVRT